MDTGADSPPLGPRGVAAALARVVASEGPRLVLLGKQAIDDDAGATGQMLAGMLAWPQATFASSILVVAGGAGVTVTREVDGGLRTLALTLPAVVTADLRLNTPRHASLPAVMKAKKAAVPVSALSALGAVVTRHTRTVTLAPPPARRAGVRVESAAELVDKLKNEARVL